MTTKYIYQVHNVIPSFFSSPEKAIKHAWATLAPSDHTRASDWMHEESRAEKANGRAEYFLLTSKASLREKGIATATWDFGGKVITRHELL